MEDQNPPIETATINELGQRPPIKFITIHELAELLNCSESKVQTLRRERQLPQPCKLGASVRWILHEVEAHMMANRAKY